MSLVLQHYLIYCGITKFLLVYKLNHPRQIKRQSICQDTAIAETIHDNDTCFVIFNQTQYESIYVKL